MGSVRFPGSGHYLDSVLSELDPAADFTWGCWARVNAFANFIIVSAFNSATDIIGTNYANTDGTINANSLGANTVVATGDYADWFLIIWRHTAGGGYTVSYCLNTDTTVTHATHSVAEKTDLTLFQFNKITYGSIPGGINDFWHFFAIQRRLSDAEVQQFRNDGVAPASPLYYLPFDNAATVATNLGSGSDFVLTGSPTDQASEPTLVSGSTGTIVGVSPAQTAALQGSVAVTGTGAGVSPPQSDAAQGDVIVSGTSATASGPQVEAAGGSVPVSASIATANPPQTGAAAGSVPVSASIATANPPQTGAAAGSVYGSVGRTVSPAQTETISGSIPISGSAASIGPSQTGSAVGTSAQGILYQEPPPYLYLELPAGDPSAVEVEFSVYTSGRLLVENQLNAANVNLADRQDLIDGRRVYRVYRKDQIRLPVDGTGPYLWDPRESNGKFRFVETDPSGSTGVLRRWTNFRT